MIFDFYKLNVQSHNTISHLISKQFWICGTGKSNGQRVHTIPQVFHPISIRFFFYFFKFYRFHDKILIRLSDRNKMWRHFDSTFGFCVHIIQFLLKACQKEKLYCVTTIRGQYDIFFLHSYDFSIPLFSLNILIDEFFCK